MIGPAAFLDLLARAELRSAAGDWTEAAELWNRVVPLTGSRIQWLWRSTESIG